MKYLKIQLLLIMALFISSCGSDEPNEPKEFDYSVTQTFEGNYIKTLSNDIKYQEYYFSETWLNHPYVKPNIREFDTFKYFGEINGTYSYKYKLSFDKGTARLQVFRHDKCQTAKRDFKFYELTFSPDCSSSEDFIVKPDGVYTKDGTRLVEYNGYLLEMYKPTSQIYFVDRDEEYTDCDLSVNVPTGSKTLVFKHEARAWAYKCTILSNDKIKIEIDPSSDNQETILNKVK